MYSAFSKCILGKKMKTLLIDNNEKMTQANGVFKERGFKFLVLLKMSPLLPVSIFNYAVGGFDSKLY